MPCRFAHIRLLTRFTLGLLIALAVLFPAIVQAADAERQKLVFTTFPSEGMGLLFERILTEAYDRLGYDIAIERVPAQRALVMANSGQVDGEAGRVPVIELLNPKLIRVPTSIYTNTIVVYARGVNADTSRGWDALVPFSVASVIGYKFIEQKLRTLRHTHVSDYEKMFTMLEGGRVDLAVAEYFDSLPSFKQLRPKDVVLVEPPLAYNPMYHYLHEKHANLVPLINRALEDMRSEGRFDAIEREMLEEFRDR